MYTQNVLPQKKEKILTVLLIIIVAIASISVNFLNIPFKGMFSFFGFIMDALFIIYLIKIYLYSYIYTVNETGLIIEKKVKEKSTTVSDIRFEDILKLEKVTDNKKLAEKNKDIVLTYTTSTNINEMYFLHYLYKETKQFLIFSPDEKLIEILTKHIETNCWFYKTRTET